MSIMKSRLSSRRLPATQADPSAAARDDLFTRVRQAQGRAASLGAELELTITASRMMCQIAADRRSARRTGLAAGILTPRQLEILDLMASGLVNKQIAQELWLSPATVRNHATAIFAALDAHSRLEAVAKGRKLGLID
jgi:DNA-binding NarL/FixJ family response regulator